MKRFLLLLNALISVFVVKANVIPSAYYSEVAAGEFYLYNVTQQQFLTGSPAMSATPVAMTLAVVDENKYSIAPTSGGFLKMGYWNNQYLWNNSWADTGFFKWSFTADGTKTYNLSITATADADGYFTNGTTYYLNTVNTAPSTEAAAADEWALITEADWYNYLASTTATIPASYYTTAPSAGTYYLYNIEWNGFLYRGGDGNYAGLKTTPEAITLMSNGSGAFYVKFSDGKYLKTGTYNGYYVWTDASDESFAWTFESFHDVTGLFLIKCPLDDADRYLYSSGIGVRGVNGWTKPDANRTQYAWALISEENYTAWQNSFVLDEATGYTATSDVYNVNPTVKRTMTANVWNTLVVPFDMAIPSGWTVKEPTAFDGGTLTFGDASSIVHGKPYIVKPTSDVTSFSASGVTLYKDLQDTNVSDGALTMTGTYTLVDALPFGSYVVGIKDGTSALYRVNSNVSCAPFRAYFVLPTESLVKGNVLNIIFDNTETAISAVESLDKDSGLAYNLAGQRVSSPKKGLYIIGGKKVIIK